MRFFYFFCFLLSIRCESSEEFQYFDIYSPIDLVFNVEGTVPNNYFESLRVKSLVERINLSLYINFLSKLYFNYLIEKDEFKFSQFLRISLPEFDFLFSLYKEDSFLFFNNLLVQLNFALYNILKPFTLRYWDVGLKFSCYIWKLLFIFNYSVKRSFYIGFGGNFFKDDSCKIVIITRVGRICNAIYEIVNAYENHELKDPFCLYNFAEKRELTCEEFNKKVQNMFSILNYMGCDTDCYNNINGLSMFLQESDPLGLGIKYFQLKLIFCKNEKLIFNKMLSYFNISKEEADEYIFNKSMRESCIYDFVKKRTNDVILNTKDKKLLNFLINVQEYFLNDRFFNIQENDCDQNTNTQENTENFGFHNSKILLKSLLDVLEINIDRFNEMTMEEKREIIKSQYKILVCKYHPDKGGSKEVFQKLLGAKEVLYKMYC